MREGSLPSERFDLALAFKLLPLLGAEGMSLLERVPAAHVAVSLSLIHIFCFHVAPIVGHCAVFR